MCDLQTILAWGAVASIVGVGIVWLVWTWNRGIPPEIEEEPFDTESVSYVDDNGKTVTIRTKPGSKMTMGWW